MLIEAAGVHVLCHRMFSHSAVCPAQGRADNLAHVYLLARLAMGPLRNAVFSLVPLRLTLIQMLFWFLDLELSKLCLFCVSSFLEFLAFGFWK